jgi:hypothetical protein
MVRGSPTIELAMYSFNEEGAGNEPGARNILPTSEIRSSAYRTKKIG